MMSGDNNGLRALLECPVCLDVRPNCNYFNCKQSHKICQHCFNQLDTTPKKCPTCRGEYDRPGPRRNLDVEQIISKSDLDFHCAYFWKNGCAKMFKRDELEPHQVECPNRTVVCPLAVCKKNVMVSAMGDHIKEEHKNYVLSNLLPSGLIYNFKANVTGYFCAFFHADKLFFHFMKKSAEGLWYHWVSTLSSEKEARKWKIEITIDNEEKSISTTMKAFVTPYEGQTAYVTANQGNVWEEWPGDCLVMTDPQQTRYFMKPSLEEATDEKPAGLYMKFALKKVKE